MVIVGELKRRASLSLSFSVSVGYYYSYFTSNSGGGGWGRPDDYVSTRRDSYHFTHLLQRCTRYNNVNLIKEVHAQIIVAGHQRNPFAATKLLDSYALFSMDTSTIMDIMDYASSIFHSLLDTASTSTGSSSFVGDVFMWNVMIRTYLNAGCYGKALQMYPALLPTLVPNQYTFPFLLKASAAITHLLAGTLIHSHLIKFGFHSHLFVANALLAFYAKCRHLQASRRVFDEMPLKDLVSWNSILSAYTLHAHYQHALLLFHDMKRDHAVPPPDHATLVAILPACAHAAAVLDGLWIHTYVVKAGMDVDAPLGCGLISMYANCGRLTDARLVFDRVHDKNIVVWNAIIRCYGMHGYADEALHLFSGLLGDGLRPDAIIFLGLLSACSHAGMVPQGWDIFDKMQVYGVERSNEHYACMVDLLGRVGFLDEAVDFIQKMPMQPGKDVLGALLGACKIHKNIELAEQVAEKLFVLDPHNAAPHVTMAKMYQDAGRLADAAKARTTLRDKKLKKQSGYSSVEVDCVFHTFGKEDEFHPLTKHIFDTLDRLHRVMEDDMLAA